MRRNSHESVERRRTFIRMVLFSIILGTLPFYLLGFYLWGTAPIDTSNDAETPRGVEATFTPIQNPATRTLPPSQPPLPSSTAAPLYNTPGQFIPTATIQPIATIPPVTSAPSLTWVPTETPIPTTAVPTTQVVPNLCRPTQMSQRIHRLHPPIQKLRRIQRLCPPIQRNNRRRQHHSCHPVIPQKGRRKRADNGVDVAITSPLR